MEFPVLGEEHVPHYWVKNEDDRRTQNVKVPRQSRSLEDWTKSSSLDRRNLRETSQAKTTGKKFIPAITATKCVGKAGQHSHYCWCAYCRRSSKFSKNIFGVPYRKIFWKKNFKLLKNLPFEGNLSEKVLLKCSKSDIIYQKIGG